MLAAVCIGGGGGGGGVGGGGGFGFGGVGVVDRGGVLRFGVFFWGGGWCVFFFSLLCVVFGVCVLTRGV